MLKLSVGPSTLEKDLETIRRALKELLDDAEGEGLKIFAYPSIDNIVASALLFRHLVREGLGVSLSISLLPPQKIENPSLLVGYSSLSYGSKDLGARIIALAQRAMRAVPPPGAMYLELEGSASSFIAILLGADIEESISLAPLAGSYDSQFVGEYGRFSGLDAIALERLRLRSQVMIDMVTTIKAYKPHLRTACEALTLTSSPYYGGITGIGCEAVSDLKGFSDRPLASLSREDLERLAEAILLYLKKTYKRDVEPIEFLGGLVIARAPGALIADAREARDALVFAAEAARDIYYASVAVIDAENEYPIAENRLEGFAKRLAELASRRPERNKAWRAFPLYEVEISKGDSPTLLWGALYTAGLIERESALSFRLEDRKAISVLQLEAALGRGKGAELVASGLASEEGGFLLLSSAAQ